MDVIRFFRNLEQKIGVQNLLKLSAGEKAFCSPGSSVHTLDEIAIAKLLSPSQVSHSVSLYPQYMEWMEQNGIEHCGFKGFTANRFGRIAEIAKQFLKMRTSIMELFDAVVDIQSNKLVLGVSMYVQSAWFVLC